MSTNHPSIQLTSVRVDPAAGPVIQPWRIDFVYDGLRRMRRALTYTWNSGSSGWTSVGETRYLYDGMLIVQERSSGNTPQVHYTRGLDLSGTTHGAGGIGGLLMRSHGYSAGSWSSHNGYHSDANGNVTALVNSSGSLQANYKYNPYGGTISSSGTLATANVMRFSSKPAMFSSTGGWGMYYYGYRFYDPATQRWLNRDPLEEAGGINTYEANANNPLNAYDPVGLDWKTALKFFNPISRKLKLRACKKEAEEWKDRCLARIPSCTTSKGGPCPFDEPGEDKDKHWTECETARVNGLAKCAEDANSMMEACYAAALALPSAPVL
jgi:RHS repeat-associated protein